MSLNKFRYSILFRAIAIAVVCLFLVNDIAYTLATWSAFQSPTVKREILTALEQTQIVKAGSDAEANRLLAANNAEALLLSHCKYLVSNEVADNPLRLIRAITHEDIEVLMQILWNEDRYRYNAIKDIILGNKKIKQYYYDLCYEGREPRHLTIELMLNDIIAKAFELMFVAENGFVVAEDYKSKEEQEKEARFYLTIRQVIMANRHNYFRDGLFISPEDTKIRSDKIRNAMVNGMVFYQAAAPQSSFLRQYTGLPLSALQTSLVGEIEEGHLQGIKDTAKKDAINRWIKQLDGLSRRFDPKKLKEALRQSDTMRVARGVKWEEVASLLADRAQNELIFEVLATSIDFPSLALGEVALILADDIPAEVALMMLAKEGCVLYWNTPRFNFSALDREARAFTAAFAIYCTLSDSERSVIQSFYAGRKDQDQKRYEFLAIFGRLYREILQKPSTDVRREMETYVKKVYPSIETDVVPHLGKSDIGTLELNDRPDVADLGFLKPTTANPCVVSSPSALEPCFIYKKEIKRRAKSIEISVTPIDRSRWQTFLRIRYQRPNDVVRTLQLAISSEKQYNLNIDNETLGHIKTWRVNTTNTLEDVFDYIGTMVGILLDLPEVNACEGFADALHQLQEFVHTPYVALRESAYGGIDFITKADFEERRAQDARWREEERARQTAEAAAASERRKKPFSLEYARVRVIPYKGDRKHAEELADSLKQIGFADVRTTSMEVESGYYGSDIIIVAQPHRNDPNSPTPEIKNNIHNGEKVFEWSVEDGVISEVLEPEVYTEDWRERDEVDEDGRTCWVYGPVGWTISRERIENCVRGETTAAVVAEFVTRSVVKDLRRKKEPLIAGGERLTILPEYVPTSISDPYDEMCSSVMKDARVAVISQPAEGVGKIDPRTIEKGEEIAASLRLLGFKNVRVVNYFLGPDENKYDLFIHVQPRSLDVAKEREANRLKERCGKTANVFEWFFESIIFSEIVNPGRYHTEYEPYREETRRGITFGSRPVTTCLRQPEFRTWRGNAAMPFIAQFVLQCTVEDRLTSKEPFRKDIEKSAPSSDTGVEMQEVSWGAKMESLLKSAETAIYIASEREKRAVESCEIRFARRPAYHFVENVPYLIFERVEITGPVRLREDDEIAITFDGNDRVWQAVVIEAEDERLVCTVPRGFDLKKDLTGKEGGIIKKRYNDITAKIQMEFLRNVMEHMRARDIAKLFPLVSIALGLEKPQRVTTDAPVDLTLLSNQDIHNNEDQLQMISAALNGLSIELGWGPPGTGKTTVAGEILYQNWLRHKTQLVAAQTNRAVDNLLLKAKAAGIKVYRVGNHPQIFDPRLRDDWLYRHAPRAPAEPKEGAPDEEWQAYEGAVAKHQEEYQGWVKQVKEEIMSGKAIVGGTCVGLAIDRFLNREMTEEREIEGGGVRSGIVMLLGKRKCASVLKRVLLKKQALRLLRIF